MESRGDGQRDGAIVPTLGDVAGDAGSGSVVRGTLGGAAGCWGHKSGRI